MSRERELRDAAEVLQGRVARLERELSAHPPPAASGGGPERLEALRTARLELERRREELAKRIFATTTSLVRQRAVHEAVFGWTTSPNDSRVTQDEAVGAVLGCALVVGPLLVARELSRLEDPWVLGLLVALVLLASLALAARQGFRAGRTLGRLDGEAPRGGRAAWRSSGPGGQAPSAG